MTKICYDYDVSLSDCCSETFCDVADFDFADVADFVCAI